MSSGFTHFLITGLLALSFLVGGVLVDFDHFKFFGGEHSLKQMWSGFKGVSYVHGERQDQNHFFHQQKVFKSIFFVIGCLVMFGVGYFLHLYLDGLL